MFDPYEFMLNAVFWVVGAGAVAFGLKLLIGIARMLHG